jgi:hypothetical protein
LIQKLKMEKKMERHQIKRTLKSLGNSYLNDFGVSVGFLRRAKLSVKNIPSVAENGWNPLVIEWKRKDFRGNLVGGQILIPA